MLKRFYQTTEGATAIEYGLIGALIFLALVVGVTLLGTGSNGMYGNIVTETSGVM
jgi:pilus assembly protein Flp/PilA